MNEGAEIVCEERGGGIEKCRWKERTFRQFIMRYILGSGVFELISV